ncbi:hypothetical protein QGN32_20555 [Mycolicibacterium sp. ND9-15]|uniref:hypothetical protein n=1 Tax=Mycolicibacterium sp. ND9-15 TaxID=3042320 RepID=UPI002DDB37B5|nr:hypothetical protein [Mycolicibacterium sp. ND9-15]WSE55759.1 hypothetical protein QGN32_20555 [Mycolicibacterium sp. ND9-15]
MSRPPYAPRSLGAAGRRLWRDALKRYDEWTPGERIILIEAARTADLCERLGAASARDNCPRSTLVELRQQRLALAKLIAELGI